MRVLSARIRNITIDKAARRVTASVHLLLWIGGEEYSVAVHTSAPITAPGAAPLKSRLIAAAKLMVAMRAEDGLLPDALLADRAA
ncbi:MAG TPA: hypothetical protein PK450_10340 [Paracoccaceae bacterium]|nr:hypothetical protein [Paracoccaceae bacterium]